MKMLYTFSFLFIFQIRLPAQEVISRLPASGIPRPNLASVGIAISLGNFSSTHKTGFSIQYSRSRYSYGKRETKTPLLLSYTIHAGINYFPGKKETISAYSYSYPGNTWAYLTGGGMLLPTSSLCISITAGPALMRYNGISDFAFTSKLELHYFLRKRIAVSPSLQLLKPGKAGALWAAGIKGGFAF